MSRFKLFLLILIFANLNVLAQELQWKTGLNYFFDNTEFTRSSITIPQTMTGVHLSPEIGVKWDTVHSVFAGVDVLKNSGTSNVVDKTDVIAYYQYLTPATTFRAGSFQREEVLSNYSDLFFQDSVKNFRPLMQGIFWQVKKNSSFFNLWLDWVSHQTNLDREIFFIGASGHKRLGFLFADFQSYMYHFAGRANNLDDHLCDNALGHLSVGVDYSNKQGLDTLLFAVGVLAGYEKDRDNRDNRTYTPLGAVLRLNAEYRGIGLDNMFYVGQPRMELYKKYGGNLYWSNPFLRSNYYLESKLYLNVIHTPYVEGKIASKFHFSEGKKIMFEQTFNLSVSLNNFSKHKNTPSNRTFDLFHLY